MCIRDRTIREAAGALADSARGNLRAGSSHPTVGVEVKAHLDALEGRFAATQNEQPLTREWVLDWNKKAQGLIQRLIEQQQQASGVPLPVPAPPVGIAQPIGAPPPPRPVLLEQRLDASDAGAVDSLLAEVRKALRAARGSGTNARIRVVVTYDESGEGGA